MDPIYPWLDSNEVRRMAERLLNPGDDTAMSAADVGFDETFIGYGAHEVTQPAASPADGETTGEPPQSLPTAPVIQTVPESQAAENFTTLPTALLERITRFRDRMRHEFSATDLFILDRDGAVIFDESRHGRLHFLGRSVAQASQRSAVSLANVRVKIGAQAILEVIPVETVHGSFILGAVFPTSLSQATIAFVMEALSQAISPTASTSALVPR